MPSPAFHLTFLERHSIRKRKKGLLEPSGVALASDGDLLWVVCDETRALFGLSLEGRLERSIRIAEKGLEGITLAPGGQSALVVEEKDNEVLEIELRSGKELRRQRLEAIEGFEAIAEHFRSDGRNKGLEGISINAATGSIVVMKERDPGLLIEISSDLSRILGVQALDHHSGFVVAGQPSQAIDFSDLCYDISRDQFWILSDQARRLFLYDWRSHRVVHSAPLAYGHKGHYREVSKPEGIAIDPERRRLYVVSDDEARLYVFDVR